MKVLQIGKYFAPYKGGIETVTRDIALELSNLGIKNDVICFEHRRLKPSIETFHKSKIYKMGTILTLASAPIGFKAIAFLNKIVHNYDVFHFHHPNPFLSLGLLLPHLGEKKIIIHWHSDIIRQKIANILYKPLLNTVLNRADLILVTSPNYLDKSQQLRYYTKKCRILPIGIDNTIEPYSQNLLKKISHTYKEKKIILSVGRLVYYKGFEYLIDAGRYLDDSYQILIVGNGPEKDYLKNKITERKLNQKVTLLGRVSDEELFSYLDQCDAFCLPSVERSEAFGVVLLEAMKRGKPIVATNIIGSGVPWVTQDGLTGYNAKPRDGKHLAECINKLFADTEKFALMQINCKTRFSENFTRDKMAQQLAQFYETLEN